MSSIQSNKIPFANMARHILAYGNENTIVVQGGPGTGKSSLIQQLKASHPDYPVGYVDCQNLSLGDLAMPIVDPVKLVTKMAPNEVFCISPDKPSIIMLDEIGKCASDEVFNMLLPLLLEHRLGSVYAHPDSIVFATSNLEADQLGDRFPAHALSRVTTVKMSAPTPDEWIKWAIANNITGQLIALVKVLPDVLATYDDLDDAQLNQNPYIFNPRRGKITQYTCHRSLAKCSKYMADFVAGEVDAHDFYCLAAGTVGEACAAQLLNLGELTAKLPSKDLVMLNPRGALDMLHAVSESGLNGAHLLAVTLANNLQSAAELDAVCTFMKMIDHAEVRFLYQQIVTGRDAYASWRPKSQACRDLTAELSELLYTTK